MAKQTLSIELTMESKAFTATMQQVNDSFSKTNKDLQKFERNLQKIGASMAAAGAGISSALTLAVYDLARAADRADDTAKRTGLTVEAVQELGYAAKMCGTDLSTVEGALRKMQKNVSDTGTESKAFKETLGTLGIKLSDLRQMNPQDQFDTLSRAIANVADPTKRAGLAMQIFGQQGTALLPMLAEGADGITKLKEEAHQFGYVMSAETAQAGSDFNDNVDRLSGAVQGLWQTLATALLPVMSSLIRTQAEVVAGIKGWIEQHPALAKGAVLAAAAIGAILTAFGGLITACATWAAMAPAIGTAWTIATGPVGLTIAAIAAVVAGIIALWKNWDAVCHYMKQAWDALTIVVCKGAEMWLASWEKVLGWVPGLGEKLRGAMYKLQGVSAQAAFDIGQRQLKYEKEKNEKLLQETESAAKRQSAIWQAQDLNNQVNKTAETKKGKNKNKTPKDKKQKQKEAPLAFAEAWSQAFKECEEKLLNWKDLAADVFNAVQNNLQTSVGDMISQIGKGWDGLYDIIKKFGQNMLQSVIEVTGKIISQWVMKTVVLENLEKGWLAFKKAMGWQEVATETAQRSTSTAMQVANDTVEIKSAAALAAARATAASAWSLWGALAIGAAIGAAVMAFVGAFATGGIVPGNSFTGDNVLARVNSGEMILNQAQQARLFELANGEGRQSSGTSAVINQTIHVSGGGNLEALTQAIKRGTAEALEFANVTYKAGQKRNKYVG